MGVELMTFKTKTELVRETNLRTLGIVEYINELKNQGLDDDQVLAKMIVDKISRTPRSVQETFTKFKNISKQIGWIK